MKTTTNLDHFSQRLVELSKVWIEDYIVDELGTSSVPLRMAQFTLLTAEYLTSLEKAGLKFNDMTLPSPESEDTIKMIGHFGKGAY